MMMELRQLRYLVTVADEANFTRAAEKVFVSQSALSQQIQALESEVGAQLLDRSRRGIRLTAAGEVLYQHARRILVELEEAETAIRELEGLQRGTLRVGVVQTVNDYLMPAVATAFSARHPVIRLSIDELPSDSIERRLEEGDIQVGLSFVPTANPALAETPLLQEQLALVVPRGHALAGQRSVAVRALHDLPVILLARTFCTRSLWEENARLAGAQPRVMMELNTVSSILSLVETTGMATILPRLTLMAEPRQGLVSIDLHAPSPSRQVGLLWHKERTLCAASRAFIAVTREIAGQFTTMEAAAS